MKRLNNLFVNNEVKYNRNTNVGEFTKYNQEVKKKYNYSIKKHNYVIS